ncbi:hypothetical protein D3C77_440200 [compost metagenome]
MVIRFKAAAECGICSTRCCGGHHSNLGLGSSNLGLWRNRLAGGGVGTGYADSYAEGGCSVCRRGRVGGNLLTRVYPGSAALSLRKNSCYHRELYTVCTST